jgi:hypothetical protein
MRLSLLSFFGLSILGSVTRTQAGNVAPPATFYKDVLPVLQKNCQKCHRPGEIAPASFLTYESTRPWAKAIKTAVLSKKMPPWFADPHYGQFENDRALSETDIHTLVAWVDGGAPEGDPKNAPKPVVWATGWHIGKPDVVFSMAAEYHVPASGTIGYQYLVIPTGFTEDKYVQAVEVRPGNPKLVHHIVALVREPGYSWLKQASLPDVPFPGEILAGYLPGSDLEGVHPGRAKLIKAGSDLVLQIHYTPNGTAGTDISQVGLIFSKKPVAERVLTLNIGNMVFSIPPGAPDTEVHSKLTLQRDVTLLGLRPHMHFRGKSFQFRATYPDGKREVLLSVPEYDFNWQQEYDLAREKKLPRGTVIECEAHFDNSRNNRFNPDPTKEVHFGEQTWEEMMIGFLDVAVPTNTTHEDVELPKHLPAPARNQGEF